MHVDKFWISFTTIFLFFVSCSKIPTDSEESIEQPVFDPSPGVYTSAQNVMILCATSGVKVYYTTDGSIPTENDSSLDSGQSVLVSTTTNLKARAFGNGLAPSDITGGTYTITQPPEMVLVQGGPFRMGDTFEEGDNDELPVHWVTVSSFLISSCEVTQRLFQDVMGINPSYHTGDPSRPVEEVTWMAAVNFCNALSLAQGLTVCYEIDGIHVACDFSANGYRLATEAEWEYAAKGGTLSQGHRYSGSDDLDVVGWFYENSGGTTHPVGQKSANELGLYDMSGNVYEWCWDWYEAYGSDPQTNPSGPASGSFRVIRGGSMNVERQFNRSSNRGCLNPGTNFKYDGIRLARTL